MEQRILARLCPGQPIRRVGCNGDNVPIERVCEFIASQIRLFGNRHHPIVVILDREKREQSVAELTVTALLTLQNLDVGDQDIRIFISDREFEDWYLKDIDGICAHFKITRPAGTFAGKGGLKDLMRSIAIYHETTIGVDLFWIVSLSRIAEECGVFAAMMALAAEIKCTSITDRVEVLI